MWSGESARAADDSPLFRGRGADRRSHTGGDGARAARTEAAAVPPGSSQGHAHSETNVHTERGETSAPARADD